MEKVNITDDQLLDFLDGLGTDTERKALQESISKNPLAQKRLKDLERIHYFLQKQDGLLQPSKNFTEKVMEGLHAKPSFTFFSPKNGLILLTGLIVASGLAIALLSAGTFDQLHTIFNFDSIPLKTDKITIPKSMPFDLKVAVKIFVMVNLVIALILLDRTILRPIFQKRSQQFG